MRWRQGAEQSQACNSEYFQHLKTYLSFGILQDNILCRSIKAEWCFDDQIQITKGGIILFWKKTRRDTIEVNIQCSRKGIYNGRCVYMTENIFHDHAYAAVALPQGMWSSRDETSAEWLHYCPSPEGGTWSPHIWLHYGRSATERTSVRKPTTKTSLNIGVHGIVLIMLLHTIVIITSVLYFLFSANRDWRPPPSLVFRSSTSRLCRDGADS